MAHIGRVVVLHRPLDPKRPEHDRPWIARAGYLNNAVLIERLAVDVVNVRLSECEPFSFHKILSKYAG